MRYEQLAEAKILGAIDALLTRAAWFRYPTPVPPEYQEARDKIVELMARLASEAGYKQWSDMYEDILSKDWPALTDMWVDDIVRVILGIK
jgi:hypothetical protein